MHVGKILHNGLFQMCNRVEQKSQSHWKISILSMLEKTSDVGEFWRFWPVSYLCHCIVGRSVHMVSWEIQVVQY